jgi:hypothetical protein
MGKMLRWDDVMPSCPAILDGENAFDVAVRAREHALRTSPPASPH